MFTRGRLTYHAAKEVMFFDFEGSGCAQSFERVLSQQRADDIFRLRRHGPVFLIWPLDIVVDRVSEQFLRRVTKERDTADQKLVQDYAHAPPVDRLAVALPQDYFRRDVFGSPEHL